MSDTHITHPHGEQLSAYIDSMLDVARMRGIGEHLRGCNSCRRAEADLRRTKSELHGLPAPTPPDAAFWASAYRTLRVDDRKQAAAKRPFWAGWRGPEQAAHRRWAGGLAAVAVAVGVFAARPAVPVTRPVTPPAYTAPAPQVSPDVSPDVSSLAELHTDSVSRLPLADPDRQKMIAADARQFDARQSDTQQSGSVLSASEAAGYADASY